MTASGSTYRRPPISRRPSKCWKRALPTTYAGHGVEAMALNLFAIPPGVPFLDALADGWLRESGADPLSIANGLILTPTRRAARSLAEAFLRVSEGRGLLLPRIVALGALDEA